MQLLLLRYRGRCVSAPCLCAGRLDTSCCGVSNAPPSGLQVGSCMSEDAHETPVMQQCMMSRSQPADICEEPACNSIVAELFRMLSIQHGCHDRPWMLKPEHAHQHLLREGAGC